MHGRHAITIRFAESSRDGRYAQRPDSHQRVQTFSIAYTLLGDAHFSAVDWRESEAGASQD